jgi:ATP-dependent DNA helicase RecG
MQYLKPYCQYFSEHLPEKIIQKYDFMSKAQALEIIHFPKSQLELDAAKYRLAYEELYEINYKTLSKKHQVFKDST